MSKRHYLIVLIIGIVIVGVATQIPYLVKVFSFYKEQINSADNIAYKFTIGNLPDKLSSKSEIKSLLGAPIQVNKKDQGT